MTKRNISTPVQILDIPFPETWEIERRVLADAVTAPEFLGENIAALHPDFFTSDERRLVWEKITEKYNLGEPIDIATIYAAAPQEFKTEVLPKTGIPPSLIEFTSHVTALRTGATRRRAYIAAVQFIQQAVNASESEQDIIAGVEAFAAQVDGPAPIQTEVTLAAALKGVREDVRAAERAAAEGKTIHIATGLATLDVVINGGFKPGQLVILAARPGVGKTSVMLHLAKNAARAGFPVYISTLEMTDTELGEKFLYSTGRVRPYEVSHGAIDWTQFDAAQDELEGLPILINQFSRSLDQIIGRITQAVKCGKCRIAFIDYLGLFQDCTTFGGNMKLYQVIARVTTTLKSAAKRLGIPVVLLCQLNREAARDGRAPELYDLRDSGSIEQDADIVLMLEPQKDRSIVAWLRKNRSGRKTDGAGNDVGLRFMPNDTFSAFEDCGPVKDAGTIDLPEPVTTPKEQRNKDDELF